MSDSKSLAVPNTNKFQSAAEFLCWLKNQTAEALHKSLEANPESDLTDLWAVFEKNAGVRGDYSMIKISQSLGMAVPDFMKFARSSPGLHSGAEKKNLVVSCTIALYHLIDGGIGGGERNVERANFSGHPSPFGENGNMEDMFARPLAEQAVEKAYAMFKSLE